MTFGGENVIVPVKLFKNAYTIKNFMLAYCITVHKAQGSEWDNIYYYISGHNSPKFLNKRMIYTAITRARKICTIIETTDGLFERCANTQIQEHYGGLEEQLKHVKR
jgi:exodeoxyribonuclease V alpha subunit